MDLERWKWIDENTRLYQISNWGRVKTFNNSGINRINSRRKIGKIITPKNKKNYYSRASIKLNNKHKNFFVHRLVAQAFIPNPENKEQINHIDGIKSNNHYKNLEWVTPSENILHAFRVLHRKNVYGEQNALARFTEKTVREIRTLYKTGNYTRMQLRLMFNMSQTNIYNIIHGITWRHIL